jgi:dethiobiotin synthetase
MKGYFVTGTDTGVGKTWMTTGLVQVLADRGFKVAGLKPLACGGRDTAQGWRHEDAELLMRHNPVALPYEAVNPCLLREPIAPHIAAARIGLHLSAAALHQACTALEVSLDYWLIEGVGGWQVPLNDEETTADFAQRLDLPVILVVGLRLGCLNHALLTSDSVARYGLRLAGWIANVIDPDMDYLQENIAALEARLPAPRLGTVPHLEEFDATRIAAALDVGLLGVRGEGNYPPHPGLLPEGEGTQE